MKEPMGKPVVLLVDDDPDDVDIALRALRREDLEVRVEVARDGGEALERLGVMAEGEGEGEAPGSLPRAVFLDLNMPRVDGWEVLERMRQHPPTRRLPVVVLSSSARREDIDRCYALGANSYLVKRFEAGRPGSYFADAVRYWAHANEVPACLGASGNGRA